MSDDAQRNTVGLDGRAAGSPPDDLCIPATIPFTTTAPRGGPDVSLRLCAVAGSRVGFIPDAATDLALNDTGATTGAPGAGPDGNPGGRAMG